MGTITSHQADLSSARDLQIKVPAKIYLLSNSQIAESISYLQQLIDLASTIADGLDQVQPSIRELGCDCILTQIIAPTKAYTNKLRTRYLNHHFITTPSTIQGAGLAALIAAKVRLRRTIKSHVQLIEGDLVTYGEKIKIFEIFSPDARILADLGSGVSEVIDRFLIAGAGLCECGKAKVTRMASLKLSSSVHSPKLRRTDRSNSLAQASIDSRFSERRRA